MVVSTPPTTSCKAGNIFLMEKDRIEVQPNYPVGYFGSNCATHIGQICARHFGPNCATNNVRGLF